MKTLSELIKEKRINDEIERQNEESKIHPWNDIVAFKEHQEFVRNEWMKDWHPKISEAEQFIWDYIQKHE